MFTMNLRKVEDMAEEKLDGSRVFSGKLLTVDSDTVRTSSGVSTTREVVHHPGGVVIVPLLDRNETPEVLLVRQFRYPVRKEVWEFPAGTLEPDEAPGQCARRELIEETGYQAVKMTKKVEMYTSPGYSDETLHLFVARDLSQVEESDIDRPEEENLQVRSFTVEELRQRALNGGLNDGKTLAGLLYLREEMQ